MAMERNMVSPMLHIEVDTKVIHHGKKKDR